MYRYLIGVILSFLCNVCAVANPVLQHKIFHLNHLKILQSAQYKKTDREYYEFLRTGSMSSGIYVIPKAGTDPQQPHTSDELYYIIGGKADIKIAKKHYAAKAGDLIYVAKNIPHHFYNITQKATVLVTMAPAEQTPHILFLHNKKLTNAEIADVLDVDINTVNSIIRKYKKLGHL
jgi:mannose-6-phosphate isomerase-like protein (cupin superfamily)